MYSTGSIILIQTIIIQSDRQTNTNTKTRRKKQMIKTKKIKKSCFPFYIISSFALKTKSNQIKLHFKKEIQKKKDKHVQKWRKNKRHPFKKTKIKSIDGGKKNKNKTTEPHTYKTTQDSQNIFSLFHYIFLRILTCKR